MDTPAAPRSSDRQPGAHAVGNDSYPIRRVGPVQLIARPNATVALLFIALCAAGTAASVVLGPRLATLVTPRLGRPVRTLRPLLVGVGVASGVAATWAGLGIAGGVVGRWCYLSGAGLFDRRGAHWHHALDWPHPIRNRSGHRIVTATGAVRTASCSAGVLHALLGAPASRTA